MQMIITNEGTVRCIYTDALDLDRIGKLRVTRGSHVEPTPDGGWTADLSPVHGPLLGPYRSRREALAAEIAWLEANWLPSDR